MSALNPTNVVLLGGTASAAVADVHVGAPTVRFRVQLAGMQIGGQRVFSVFTTCPDHSTLEYVVRFNPANPQSVDCAVDLPRLLWLPKFLEFAVGPLLARLRSSPTS